MRVYSCENHASFNHFLLATPRCLRLRSLSHSIQPNNMGAVMHKNHPPRFLPRTANECRTRAGNAKKINNKREEETGGDIELVNVDLSELFFLEMWGYVERVALSGTSLDGEIFCKGVRKCLSVFQRGGKQDNNA